MTRTLLPPDSNILLIPFDEPVNDEMLFKLKVSHIPGIDVCDVFVHDCECPFSVEIYYN